MRAGGKQRCTTGVREREQVKQRLEDEGAPLKEDARPRWRVSRIHFRPVEFARCTLALPAVALRMQELARGAAGGSPGAL
jgi:hypothetical protein